MKFNKNKYSMAWLIVFVSGLVFLIIGFSFSVKLDGFCATTHECYLVNDLGMTEYLSYFGYGNPDSIILSIIGVFLILGSMVPAKLEEVYGNKN